jgi:putative transposase
MTANRKPYPSDLSDDQWSIIAHLLPHKKAVGRPGVDLREVVNSVLYIYQSGQEWRMMPHDLLPWQTVYGYYNRWLKDGTWENINAHLQLQLIQRNRLNESFVVRWISNRLKQSRKSE